MNPKDYYQNVRNTSGLSQKDFAEKFGISLSSVKNYEQGRRPAPDTIRVLYSLILSNPELVAQAVKKTKGVVKDEQRVLKGKQVFNLTYALWLWRQLEEQDKEGLSDVQIPFGSRMPNHSFVALVSGKAKFRVFDSMAIDTAVSAATLNPTLQPIRTIAVAGVPTYRSSEREMVLIGTQPNLIELVADRKAAQLESGLISCDSMQFFLLGALRHLELSMEDRRKETGISFASAHTTTLKLCALASKFNISTQDI
jgi:transcriptional regulator with XRE-family HTH domain